MDNHDVAAPASDPTDQLWVVATAGRLAGQGLLERPAESTDPVAVAGQRLLIAAGLLETDPELIRARGATSGEVFLSILEQCRAYLPGLPERLDRPGAAFLDVGTGAGGIVIAMCRAHEGLHAVGLDISAVAVTAARGQVAEAGLGSRAKIREQSVAAIEDVDAFDLLWVPQLFLPEPVLAQALPRLQRAARPGAGLLMPILTNSHTGVRGAATDLRNLMTGGGTLSAQAARTMLRTAGFSRVETVDLPAGTVIVAAQ